MHSSSTSGRAMLSWRKGGMSKKYYYGANCVVNNESVSLRLSYSGFDLIIGDRDDREEDGVKRKKKKKKDRDGTAGSGIGKDSVAGINSCKSGGKNTNSSDIGEGGYDADGDNAIEEEIHMMDELTSYEKVIHCQVSLMEINRKLCGVIGQPC